MERGFLCPRRELNPHRPCGPQDFKSCVSTSFTTRAIFSKKNPPSWGNLSGRPGSNRPPRPWQGRALPNELLPHDHSKELKGCKNNKCNFLKKNFESLFVLGR